jgi:endogenous inhibitor of DNA gyrase (YacG/DUF329 family)
MASSCPICKKPTVLKYRPFCSKRCADIDLARWFRGDYKIPGEEAEKEEKEEKDKTEEE